jgi:hypothetical protein
MMDELISRVAQQTGLSPEQAKSAESVLAFLKTKLPAPIADNLNSILSGGAIATESGSGVLGSAAAQLGNMFGKDK